MKTRDADKPSTTSTRPKDEHAPLSRRPEDSSSNDRQREHKPGRDDDRETGFDRRRDARMRERERDRLRDRERERRERERERERERDRDRDRDRDRSRLTGAPRRARRGSSGSPFASRSGGPAGERQRSPAVGAGGSRYRRPSRFSRLLTGYVSIQLFFSLSTAILRNFCFRFQLCGALVVEPRSRAFLRRARICA